MDSNCCFEIALYIIVKNDALLERKKNKTDKDTFVSQDTRHDAVYKTSMVKNPLKINVDPSDIHVVLVLCVTPAMGLEMFTNLSCKMIKIQGSLRYVYQFNWGGGGGGFTVCTHHNYYYDCCVSY